MPVFLFQKSDDELSPFNREFNLCRLFSWINSSILTILVTIDVLQMKHGVVTVSPTLGSVLVKVMTVLHLCENEKGFEFPQHVARQQLKKFSVPVTAHCSFTQPARY